MKICVVGGGASGMLASLLISQKKHEVILIEKNEKLGKKIYITGKGRCNLTNAVTGNAFLQNVVNNSKFIMSSEVRFNSKDTMELFEDLGVKVGENIDLFFITGCSGVSEEVYPKDIPITITRPL